jgi:hypothetical protein
MATLSGEYLGGGAGEAVPSSEKTRMVFDAADLSFDPVTVVIYKMRARDSSCVSPTYVTWLATSPTTPYPGALPCGGPLVETTIVETWEVVP